MKEKYEKPEMVTEQVDIGLLAAQNGSPIRAPNVAAIIIPFQCEIDNFH